VYDRVASATDLFIDFHHGLLGRATPQAPFQLRHDIRQRAMRRVELIEREVLPVRVAAPHMLIHPLVELRYGPREVPFAPPRI
jgi:hypothetical protein